MTRYLLSAGSSIGLNVRDSDLVIGQEVISPEKARFEYLILLPFGGYISMAAISWLLSHGKSILFMGYRGEFLGGLYTCRHPQRTSVVRRLQYTMIGAMKEQLARDLISSKVNRQLSMLGWMEQRFDRGFQDQRERIIKQQDKITGGITHRQLLRVEAEASRNYWSCVRECLHKGYKFEARTRQLRGYTKPRYAKDSFNALLNYGYSILLGEVARACYATGFDPYHGVFHKEKRGMMAFAYDIIEVYRWWVDQALIDNQSKLVRITYKDRDGTYYLLPKGMGLALEVLHKSFNRQVSYRGKKYAWSAIIPLKLTELSAYLEGKRDSYTFSVPAVTI